MIYGEGQLIFFQKFLLESAGTARRVSYDPIILSIISDRKGKLLNVLIIQDIGGSLSSGLILDTHARTVILEELTLKQRVANRTIFRCYLLRDGINVRMISI
ncbi:hypothetical protein TA05_15165 [Citrobacter rodentium]|nr:hypothetical protein TA05_15165 [Citrobacter rodentium]